MPADICARQLTVVPSHIQGQQPGALPEVSPPANIQAGLRTASSLIPEPGMERLCFFLD